jgi:predicted nucleic acid-binding protein
MRAADRFFVDTNVLLYSVDSADAAKQAAARHWLNLLWEEATGCLSWQVLHEFYVNAVRKLRTPASKARATVEVFALWQPADTSLGLVQRAWHWMDEAQLSCWDSLIVAAAERGGCRWLLSEDFQSGRKFDSITVVNPFRARPEDFNLKSAPDKRC